MSDPGRLSGVCAVVTGAASGIGLATARAYSRAGASVFAVDVDGGALAAALDEMPGAVGHVADLADRAATEAVVPAAATALGRVEVIANVAGIVDRFLACDEVVDEVWDRVLAIDLTAPMILCRAALPAMVAQGRGRIINVSSLAGLHGARGGAAYTAAKHGLIGLTKSIAATHAFDGIQAIAVCPGAIATGIPWGGEPGPRGAAALERTRPANPGPTTPDDFARLLVAFASDDAAFLNGAVVTADGGWTAH